MPEPEVWGFSRPTAARLVAIAGAPNRLRPPQTQRSRQPRFVGGAGGTKIIKTPPAGIPARSGAAVNSASCAAYKIDAGNLTATGDSLTAYNLWPIAIPGDYYVTAVQEEVTLEWLIQFPGVLDVRYVLNTALEQTRDGSTYSNIETPELCS